MTARKILLVEDDADLRQAMRLLLERQGFAVLETAMGAKALALAEANQPSLILMDHGLPDGDGLEFAQELRRRQSTTRIPIVVLNAEFVIGPRAETLAKTCAGTIPKPVTRERLERDLGVALMLSRRDVPRRFPRYPVEAPAWYRPHGSSSPVGADFIAGRVRMLGEGGLRMDVASPIAKESMLDLRLRVRTGEVTTPGKVVYSQYGEDERTGTPAFQHGIQFADMDPATLTALKRLIKGTDLAP